tara:strand:+ start:102 stop:449 length:348 start_codon:yes stop_codon:yes gene_type:complete
MVKIKVNTISSISDPETSKLGTKIEFVEVRNRNNNNMIGSMGVKDEIKVVNDIISQFKSAGIFPMSAKEMLLPKMILFLSQSEYDMLAIKFEVNDIFELILKDGAFMLKRATEGT